MRSRQSVIVLLAAGCAPVAAGESDADLKARLLANYGAISTRPSLSAPARADAQGAPPLPDELRVQAYIEKYHPLDMTNNKYGFDGYLRTWWSDPRLRFNGTANGGETDKLSFGYVERSHIWKPIFYWEGAKKITLPRADSGTGELLEVYPDGSIWWSRQLTFELSCSFAESLDHLPFDTHTCTFMMGLYAETATDANVRWKKDAVALANHDDSACLPQWYVTSFVQEDVLQVYVSANYTYAKATLSFSRSPNVFIQTYLLPALLLVFCGYCGFFIDPRATPARVALGMLAIVVSSNNFVNLSKLLPVSPHPAWLLRVVLGCLYFNSYGMVNVVIVSFGILSAKWLKEEQDKLASYMPWERVLHLHSDKLVQLFEEWDQEGDGSLTRKEFRRGVQLILPEGVPITKLELNDLFDQLDNDGSRTVSIVELHDLLKAIDPSKTYHTTNRDSQSLTDGMTAEEAEANDLVLDTPDNPRSTRAPHRGGATVANGAQRSPGKSKTSLAPTEVGVEEVGVEADKAPRADHVGPGSATPDSGAHIGKSQRLHARIARLEALVQALSEDQQPAVETVRLRKHKEPAAMHVPPLPQPPPPHKRMDSTNFRKPKNTDSSQGRRLSREAVKAIRKDFYHRAAEDLDMGVWENFKTFRLFPLLAKLQYADHVARVTFPVAFAIFIFSELGAVDWFEPHYERLSHSKCYLDSISRAHEISSGT